MKNLSKPLFILLFLVSWSCAQPENEYNASAGKRYLNVPVSDIEKEVKSLLNTWYPALIDSQNGGYRTNFTYDWKLMDNQDKMLVTQARGLWAASRAAQLFPENPVFRKAADHGYQFLTEKMWDSTNKGFYQNYYIASKSADPTQAKTAYGNAFALYALAEYARINNDPQVISWIKKTFHWLEDMAHDPELKGYYNIVAARGHETDQRNFFMGDPGLKDQNSSIHLMEAFSNACQVWPDTLLKQRLQEIFILVRDTMVNDRGSLNLFFTKDWQPVSHVNQSRDYILQNIYTDHVSFGHDIETAFLLLDAAIVLNGKADSLTIRTAKRLIDHSLDKGFDKDYYGLWDKGYYFRGKEDIEIVNDHKVWWSQAEAWHTLAMITTYFPGEKRYVHAFTQMWKYINEQMTDHQYGGWYNNGLDSDPENAKAPKGHQWKGCYHDGRALMQVYQYTQEK